MRVCDDRPTTAKIMNLNPNAIPTFLLSFLLFGVGFYAAGRVVLGVGRTVLLIVAVLLAVPGLLSVLYYFHPFDQAAWFYNFKALPYAELTASGLGFAAGILQRWVEPQTTGGKLITPVTLALLLFIPFMKSVLDPVDYGSLRSTCEGEVCLQSTASTCGPTSAATLLKLFGLKASEAELARESFTYRGGTEVWYVIRALRKRGLSANVLIQAPGQISPPAPAIAGVVLSGGAGHFIAILSENAETITVGDPLKGKLVIPRSALGSSYHFTGFFLVIRPGHSARSTTHFDRR